MKIRNFFSSSFFKKHKALIPLTVILTAYFFFGLQHIGSFITADEHYWVEERIPRYFDAWSELDIRKTDINDKPGVSLALVSGPALLLHDDTTLACQEDEGWFQSCDPQETSWLYASFRLPILVVNALFLVLIFFSVRAFTGRRVALATAGFTALSPHLLGLSQIVNPDSLLWSSGSAALFAFLAFLATGRRSFAAWTVLALTLALLSKYTAIMIVFFLPVVVLGGFVLDRSFSPLRLRAQIAGLLVVSSVPFLLFALFVPEVLVPAATKFRENFLTAGTDSWLPWMAYVGLILAIVAASFLRIPKRYHISAERLALWSLRSLVGAFLLAVLALILARYVLPTWDIFTTLPFDIKDITNARYYLDRMLSPLEIAALELHPLIFSLPIAVLFLAGYALGKSLLPASSHRLPIFLLAIFSIAYLVAFGFSNALTTPRYIAILFPFFSFFAAVGLAEVTAWLRKRIPSLRYPVVVASVSVAMLGSVFSSKPFYTNFDNALLPAGALLSHSWGYGGYEAATYLNALPDVRNLTVWSDYYGVCEFFVGRCLTAYTFDQNDVRPDYYVLTRRGQIRYMARADRWEELSGLTAYRYYDRTDPDWSLDINGQEENFVKVFRVDKEFRASIVTDIDHCPSREAVSESGLDSFLTASREAGSDLIVSLGDNASHRLRDCSRTGDADARYVADRLRSSGLPTHLVLGDHDIASSVASYRTWMGTTGRDTTYYSFDRDGVHVVILDTVLGGEALRDSCADDPECSALETRLADMDMLSFTRYREKYSGAQVVRWQELRSVQTLLEQERSGIALTRSFGNRDRGRISAAELEWLKQDLASAKPDRVLVLSDHPLFPFVSDKKAYDIVDGERVREVLETSGKEVIAISGEAHLWHEEALNGIRYYIVDEFRKAGGSWAHISWGENGFKLDRVITRQESADR